MIVGVFPKWPLASVESGCMIGQHGGALVLEGLLSGLEHTFDVPLCQEALLRMATVPGTPNGRKDIENYTSLGAYSLCKIFSRLLRVAIDVDEKLVLR